MYVRVRTTYVADFFQQIFKLEFYASALHTVTHFWFLLLGYIFLPRSKKLIGVKLILLFLSHFCVKKSFIPEA